MTFVPDTLIAPTVRREIEARLDAVERENDVQLLMALESGSRAWGFPSPDSDYDIRFVYLRPRDWYLSLRPGRDVIETPIEDEIDLNGWDLRKALGLILKSNAVVLEWMASPIRYRPDHAAVATLAALADDLLDARALAGHYASLGRAAASRWLSGNEPVAVKRYFYALRPALAIRCLWLDPTARPPMNLQALVAAAELRPGQIEQIEQLVAAKSRTNEKANGSRVPELDALIRSELARDAGLPSGRLRGDQALQRADDLFLELMRC